MTGHFLNWLEDWYKDLKPVQLATIIKDPQKVAIISEDMLVGFCHEGALSSEKVKSIIPAVVELFNNVYKAGVRNFLMFQDTHDTNASEFSTYPPHCMKGSKESEMIPELRNLPFSNQFTVMEKNSLNSFWGTRLREWIDDHPQVDTYIIAGDCTDICVYQAAVGLKTLFDQRNSDVKVIVAANCVATYDMPVETAAKIGTLPHDADFLHMVFLYHMSLNGVNIVVKII